MITNSSGYNTFSSLDSIIDRLSEKYDNIDSLVVDDIIFIVRPITRKEYQYIYATDVSDVEKKDIICKICLLYPTNFDLENCPAGIPDKIYEKVIDISYIGFENTIKLIKINREEMEFLDNQMLCIISKAFPVYKYEELEEMNMIQLCKLYTRAEWMLNNVISGNLLDIVDIAEEAINPTNNDDYNEHKEENTEYENKYNLPIETYDDKPISKMTDEQRKAMDEFYRKYPQFNKATDYNYTGNNRKEFKDPPALRVNRR